MTTLTIILLTWFLTGLIADLIIINDIKEDIKIKDIKWLLFFMLTGYLSLLLVLIVLIIENVKLPKFKLPKGDTVIWKYPKKN